jgi:dihydroorotate dehydrogenase (fumarate)
MSDLKSKYLGIDIKNPIVVGASNMVTDMDTLKKAEESGAAAIVYKSLFEEQIQLESYQMEDDMEEYNERNAEMIKLFPDIKHAGPEEHLLNLRKTKESLSVPVIASLNAIYKESWVDYAAQIEQTGVDALELNFYAVPRELYQTSQVIEAEQLEALKAVKEKVNIPVSVKLSYFYSNPLSIISEMGEAGADGFVLFNRLFQPDIDLDTEDHFTPFNLSNESDSRIPLRFVGLLYGNVASDLIASSGIYSGHDVAKMILAGANSVQVVSALYKNKVDYLSTMLKELEQWMDSKGYKTLDDFRGKLSRKNVSDPFVYKRAQYIDLLLKSNELLKPSALR